MVMQGKEGGQQDDFTKTAEHFIEDIIWYYKSALNQDKTIEIFAPMLREWAMENYSKNIDWKENCEKQEKREQQLWEAFGNFCEAINIQFNRKPPMLNKNI